MMFKKMLRKSAAFGLIISVAAGLCACSSGSGVGDKEQNDIVESQSVSEESSSAVTEESSGRAGSSVGDKDDAVPYPDALSDIPDETLEDAAAYSGEKLTAFADSWTSNESLEGLTYVGAIFLKARVGAAVSHDNLLDLVFRMDVSADGLERSFYRVTEFTNLTCSGDTIEIDYSTYADKLTDPDGDGMIRVGSASYYGFRTLADVKNVRINGLKESWSSETDIDFDHELIEAERLVSKETSSETQETAGPTAASEETGSSAAALNDGTYFTTFALSEQYSNNGYDPEAYFVSISREGESALHIVAGWQRQDDGSYTGMMDAVFPVSPDVTLETITGYVYDLDDILYANECDCGGSIMMTIENGEIVFFYVCNYTS